MPEYWERPAKPDQAAELDEELIRELASESMSNKVPRWRVIGSKFIALITVIAFTLVAVGLWPQLRSLPALDFLYKSDILAKEPGIKQLQEAVFLIKTGVGQGTGFNISRQGLVVTNLHVLEKAKFITVTTPAGISYNGDLVGSLPTSDLALIKINAQELPAVQLAERPLKTAEKVTVIGNPLGFPQVVVTGEVQGLTLIKDWQEPVVMIRGVIHPGNSGSPVFNNQGKAAAVIFGVLPNKSDFRS